MTDVTITDPNFATLIERAVRPLAVRSADGTLIGYFAPKLDAQYVRADSDLPPEEIRRRANDRTSPTVPSEVLFARIQEWKK